MTHLKAMTGATLAILIAAGCGAAHEDQLSGSEAPASDRIQEAAELARIEFSDGNVVRFEELGGGVHVSEIGPMLNERRVVPRPGLTALEVFKALAPGREVPAALMRLHERMYSEEQAPASEQSLPQAAPARASDPDLEHNGEFQQYYPSANFLATMCDFPTGNGSYKHTNRTDAHNDISMDVHSAYYAVGSDKGNLTARACVGKNEGGAFDGQCGGTYALAAGAGANGFWDAGKAYTCTKKTGGVQLCFPNYKRFELRYAKISTSVNFHDCAQIGRTLTD